MLINKLAIIGVGLIGGSLARALKQAGECRTVLGYGRNTKNLERAVALGVIDDYSIDLSHVVKDADVIILATPLMTFGPLLKQISAHVKDSAIITDVGSVKGTVVTDARTVLGPAISKFIPGHPIAGTERSGVEASFAELFRDHMVILTPVPENPKHAIELIGRMWEICGAEVVTLSVEYHDLVLAATSHLPHILAYALVDCIAGMGEQDDIFKFSAGGFKDFSRIASSNPEMWSDICISNKKNLLQVVEQFRLHLDKIDALLKQEDKPGLEQLFSHVKKSRDRYLHQLETQSKEKKQS
jgi:prephenate dehydrogenase